MLSPALSAPVGYVTEWTVLSCPVGLTCCPILSPALSAPVGYVTERDSESEGSGLRRPLILAATAAGSVLLVVNALLIFCYIRRRHRRKGETTRPGADSVRLLLFG